ncbi:DUF4957 domain-containing protein [uncultured Draconibacterium sp.]|uniref:DUF4957 domain-containing protein n=1 Tax=uncultured Draconibacterium sp. TaxID=1573823 RepID=UPI0032170525
MKKNFTFKILMMACFVFIAGYSNGQAKPENYPSIGQSFVKDAETQSAVFTINFNTDQPTSTWTQVDDTTVTFSWGKARTGKGFGVTVWAADTANAPTVNPNEDFKVRSNRFRSNENPNHVASVDSMQALLAKWGEVYTGSDSAKNTLSNYSACVFDVDGDPANQAYGVHPGIYKKLEYDIALRLAGQVLTSDLSFTMNTYDVGNTGETASYDLRLKFSSTDTTIQDFYTTGSGLKSVNVAETFGLPISALNGQSEVHIYISTDGTGTAIEEGKYDPTIVVDDITVTFAAPVWIEPAGGLDGGTFSNADDPFMGSIGEATVVGLPLKIKGRVAALKITDNLYKNNKGDKFNKMLTFPDTLGVMANDGNGNYTVEVPYTITKATLDMGTMEWSNQSIEIAAPDAPSNDDLMFYFKVLPEAASYFANMEIDAGVRIFYQAHVKGTGATTIDLSGVEDEYSLADTLAGVPDSSIILLAPGKTYNVGGYAFDKSMIITSKDPMNEKMPHIFSNSNFDMVEGAAVSYIVFRNVHIDGEFDSDYVINVSKESSIGDLVFESCKVESLRGVVRIKDKPSTIENYIVKDCVMDQINGYGLLTVDLADAMVNNITIVNSTFSHFQYFIVSKNNSNSLSIESSTIYAVPEKGRQLIRYRGGDGKNNIFSGFSMKKVLVGHGWNMSGEEDYAIKGKEGLESTEIKVSQSVVMGDFAYSSDTIPGLGDGSDIYSGSSYDFWADPANGNFNIIDKTWAGFGLGDPRWVYEDTITYVLYAGAGAADAMEPSDSLLVDYLTNTGYNVMYVDDNDLVAGYDYSSYEALVIGESSSSSKVVPFGKDDDYPIPLVSMEGFGVKVGKWDWLADDVNFQESRVAGLENMEMKVLDNTHYITEGLAVDQVVSLSSAAASGDIYAWGIDLTADMPGAIALGQNQNAEITAPMMWAIPRGTALGASGQSTDNRIVIFAANAKGLDEATNDFNELVVRSLEWVLGAGGTTGISRPEVASDVLVYPNPAKTFAKVRFTLTESADVSLSLFNMMGQKIEISTKERFSVGTNEIEVNTQKLNEGLYIYVLEAGKNVAKGKLNIAK